MRHTNVAVQPSCGMHLLLVTLVYFAPDSVIADFRGRAHGQQWAAATSIGLISLCHPSRSHPPLRLCLPPSGTLPAKQVPLQAPLAMTQPAFPPKPWVCV